MFFQKTKGPAPFSIQNPLGRTHRDTGAQTFIPRLRAASSTAVVEGHGLLQGLKSFSDDCGHEFAALNKEGVVRHCVPANG